MSGIKEILEEVRLYYMNDCGDYGGLDIDEAEAKIQALIPEKYNEDESLLKGGIYYSRQGWDNCVDTITKRFKGEPDEN